MNPLLYHLLAEELESAPPGASAGAAVASAAPAADRSPAPAEPPAQPPRLPRRDSDDGRGELIDRIAAHPEVLDALARLLRGLGR